AARGAPRASRHRHRLPTANRGPSADRVSHQAFPTDCRTMPLSSVLLFAGAALFTTRPYPAKAGHPVRRGFSVQPSGLWNTGSPAFAGDDDLDMSRRTRQNDIPNTFAPEGASRCRALASGLMGRAAGRKERLSEKVAGLNARSER